MSIENENGNFAKPMLPAVLRPKMGGEALKLLKEGKIIEVENEFVFDLMRFVERKESNFRFTCRVNKLNQGWTVIEHGANVPIICRWWGIVPPKFN